MSTIGSMAVNLLMRTGAFDKPVDTSRGKYNKFRKDVKGSAGDFKAAAASLSSFSSILGGLGAGLTVGGAVSLLNSTLTSVDAIGKQAQSLDLAVGALDKYHFTAGRAGVSTQRVDAAIRSMNRRLGEARLGVGEAVTFFDKLGVDLKQFEGLTTDRKFEAIGAALGKIPDFGTKVAAFSKIFGEEAGSEMLRFFDNLPAAAADLKKLGGALTEQNAKDAAAYADAVGDIGRQASRAKQSVVLLFGPEITAGLQRVTETVGILRGAGGSGGSGGTGIVSRFGQGLSRVISNGGIVGQLSAFEDAVTGAAGNKRAPGPQNARQAAALQGPTRGEREMIRLQRNLVELQQQSLAEAKKVPIQRTGDDAPLILKPSTTGV